MNRIHCIPTVMVIFFALIGFNPSKALAHVNEAAEFNINIKVQKPSDEDIESRLGNLQTAISVKYTSEVRTRILQYTVYHRQATENLIGRAMLYFPLFDEELSKRNLPSELKNVAVIESLLRPSATSSVGAAGLWQFIKSTGRMQGLEISDVIDERRDPRKSTSAAIDYLESLYEMFDDWTLAIAAYNGGPGNVRKAIRKSGSKDFWKMRKYLPKETQAYVPRVIASMYLMNYYHSHDLQPRVPEDLLQSTIEVKTNQRLSLSELSENLNVHVDVLKKLNPSYSKGFIPANGDYPLILPVNRLFDYFRIYDKASFAIMLEKREEAQRKDLVESRDSILSIHRLANNYIAKVSSMRQRSVFDR